MIATMMHSRRMYGMGSAIVLRYVRNFGSEFLTKQYSPNACMAMPSSACQLVIFRNSTYDATLGFPKVLCRTDVFEKRTGHVVLAVHLVACFPLGNPAGTYLLVARPGLRELRFGGPFRL